MLSFDPSREQKLAFISVLKEAQSFYQAERYGQAIQHYQLICTALKDQEVLSIFSGILPVCQSYLALCKLKTVDELEVFDFEGFTDLTCFTEKFLDRDNLASLMQLRFEMVRALLALCKQHPSCCMSLSALEKLLKDNQSIIEQSKSLCTNKITDEAYYSYKILNCSFFADLKCAKDKKEDAIDIYRSLVRDNDVLSSAEISKQVIELTSCALVHYILLSLELSCYNEITDDIKTYLLKHKELTLPSLGMFRSSLSELCKMFEKEKRNDRNDRNDRIDSEHTISSPRAILHLKQSQRNKNTNATADVLVNETQTSSRSSTSVQRVEATPKFERK